MYRSVIMISVSRDCWRQCNLPFVRQRAFGSMHIERFMPQPIHFRFIIRVRVFKADNWNHSYDDNDSHEMREKYRTKKSLPPILCDAYRVESNRKADIFFSFSAPNQWGIASLSSAHCIVHQHERNENDSRKKHHDIISAINHVGNKTINKTVQSFFSTCSRGELLINMTQTLTVIMVIFFLCVSLSFLYSMARVYEWKPLECITKPVWSLFCPCSYIYRKCFHETDDKVHVAVQCRLWVLVVLY